MGKEPFADPQAQARLHDRILQQSQKCAMSVFHTLPQLGSPSLPYTKIQQKQDEPFMQFVDRLKEAVDLAPNIPPEMRTVIIKELSEQNANSNCKKLIALLGSSATIVQMIEACSQERLLWEEEKVRVHGAALAAALQKGGIGNNSNNYFNCKQPGHIRKNCPKKNSAVRGSESFNGTCNRCGKYGHKLSMCHSKFHKNGNPLPNQEGSERSCGPVAVGNKYPRAMAVSETSARPQADQLGSTYQWPGHHHKLY
ncbi:endogenous retrovirus group K member 21 Gag polyprotein-like [Macrotis lagotis]|uniref:endogenous retrovirus group K member 21 Gag polyprotein-like n=1 Tax=Macrotis lagotis TaxID=92651 RepID=UPI003D69B5D3